MRSEAGSSAINRSLREWLINTRLNHVKVWRKIRRKVVPWYERKVRVFNELKSEAQFAWWERRFIKWVVKKIGPKESQEERTARINRRIAEWSAAEKAVWTRGEIGIPNVSTREEVLAAIVAGMNGLDQVHKDVRLQPVQYINLAKQELAFTDLFGNEIRDDESCRRAVERAAVLLVRLLEQYGAPPSYAQQEILVQIQTISIQS